MRKILMFLAFTSAILVLPELIAPVYLTRTESLLTIILFLVCGFILTGGRNDKIRS